MRHSKTLFWFDWRLLSRHRPRRRRPSNHTDVSWLDARSQPTASVHQLVARMGKTAILSLRLAPSVERGFFLADRFAASPCAHFDVEMMGSLFRSQ